MDSKPSIIAVGKRKTSVARVYLRKGTGKITINKSRTLQDLLKRQELINKARLPLSVTKQDSRWDIVINVKGGGLTGQAGAISHGIARSLLKSDEDLRSVLKQHNLLTRDSRMVERKKYGRRGARRAFQFSKR